LLVAGFQYAHSKQRGDFGPFARRLRLASQMVDFHSLQRLAGIVRVQVSK